MIIRSPHRRRAASRLSAAAAVTSGFMLAVSVWSIAVGGSNPAAAVPVGGTATIEPTSGVTATEYRVKLPPGAACSGDSVSADYKVQGYIVPVSVDPASVAFGPNGRPQPPGTGANLRESLWSATGSRVTNLLTDLAVPPSVEGQISGLPALSWVGLVPNTATIIPPGDYNMGYACTRVVDGVAQLDRYWNAVATFVVDPADATGVAWAASAGPQPTTTTTAGGTTTTAPGDTTTTTAPGDTTTTTAAGGSTTTVAGGSSTTGAGGGSGGTGSTTFSGGNPSSAALASTVGQLPYTGNSPWSLVVWGAMLLVFGRMAILLGRKPKVRALGE